MDKQHIIDEIKRTAVANGGIPLGRETFFRETGIRQRDWFGKYWARWGDALQEVGFQPNPRTTAYDDDLLIGKFVGLVRELGRFPVSGELRLRARTDAAFPSHTTFYRLGGKRELAVKIIEFCKHCGGCEDVIALCESATTFVTAPDLPKNINERSAIASRASTKEGYVYMGLLTLGREKRYKIGKGVLVERRTDQLSIQLPEELQLVHAIRTDDAYGIEEYWHKRFAAKNTKGEWFSLSREDVEAFKRRKFM